LHDRRHAAVPRTASADRHSRPAADHRDLSHRGGQGRQRSGRRGVRLVCSWFRWPGDPRALGVPARGRTVASAKLRRAILVTAIDGYPGEVDKLSDLWATTSSMTPHFEREQRSTLNPAPERWSIGSRRRLSSESLKSGSSTLWRARTGP